MKTQHGSCHCGNVRFEVDADLSKGTSKCNCTYCTKVRSWKVFVQPAEFRLTAGGEMLKNYHQAAHAGLKFFCDRCGITTHESGTAVWAGGDFAAVFLATLDDADPAQLVAAPVHVYNGREDKWDQQPTEVRHLQPITRERPVMSIVEGPFGDYPLWMGKFSHPEWVN